MIRRTKRNRNPSDDKNPNELYFLKIQMDWIENDIREYFEAYTEYLAGGKHDKARKYAKLHEEAIVKRDKLQEKIEKFSKSKNPRCKTFQVKRKVGKKTIQVRRKICNPENNRIILTYGQLPTFNQFDNQFYKTLGAKKYKIRRAEGRKARNIWDNIDDDFGPKNLWKLLNLAVEQGTDESLDFASSVLETLNIEWV